MCGKLMRTVKGDPRAPMRSRQSWKVKEPNSQPDVPDCIVSTWRIRPASRRADVPVDLERVYTQVDADADNASKRAWQNFE